MFDRKRVVRFIGTLFAIFFINSMADASSDELSKLGNVAQEITSALDFFKSRFTGNNQFHAKDEEFNNRLSALESLQYQNQWLAGNFGDLNNIISVVRNSPYPDQADPHSVERLILTLEDMKLKIQDRLHVIASQQSASTQTQ